MTSARTRKHGSRICIDEDIGLVGDEKMGLQWLEGPSTFKHWNQATDWVQSLGSTNPLGWRLPTILELMSLFHLDMPLLEATTKGQYGRQWVEGMEPHISSYWFNVAVPSDLESYWAYVGDGLLTSFSFGFPFSCGGIQRKNVFAVGHWKEPDISRYTAEELIEQLGLIWAVDFPMFGNPYGLNGDLSSGGHSITTLAEAKKAEELLLMMGDKAIPALINVSMVRDGLNELSMSDRLHDHYDHTIFQVSSKWGSERAEKQGDTRTLRFRPCLAQQGALRVLKQMRERLLLTTDMITQIDDDFEARQRKLRSNREAIRVCVMCGKPLGRLQKLCGSKQHKDCTTFSE